MKALVYGHTGVVGAQLYRWLKKRKVNVSGISLDKTEGFMADVDWFFICLPTPTIDHRQDLGVIESVLDGLPYSPIHVVIRSTVLPGTCSTIQDLHPQWNVYHWPEFLSARTAWHDFMVPKVSVIGVTSEGAQFEWLQAWGTVLPNPTNGTHFTDLVTAETIKYTHNVHGALQVIYSNMVWDICHKADANYQAVAQVIPQVGYISPAQVEAYWHVGRDGYRGYDGACFPKDVAAMAGFLSEKAELLVGMERANKRLRTEKACV
jgi:UDP-glucose 6-dehydrogenase